MSDDELTYLHGRRSDKFYVSRPFRDDPQGHYAYMKIDGTERDLPRAIKNEFVLKTERAGEQQRKAMFYAGTREIKTLTLQRVSKKNGPTLRRFSLKGDEISRLLAFAVFIKTAELATDEGGRYNRADFDVDNYSVSPDLVLKLLQEGDATIIAELLERDIKLRDLIMLRSRKGALDRFHSLLYDRSFFVEQQQRYGSPEKVWQQFFESNTWIFGYGLLFLFASTFDDSKLEQTLVGASVAEHGKRPDALLRTRGRISSLCLVEIKTHATKLLREKAYRSDVWGPSEDLVSAVAQVQRAAYAAEKRYNDRIRIRDSEGNPTGEEAYVVRPRSLVVIGDLQEFKTEHGDSSRFVSFELFRRPLEGPEIITFDELYERARFIAEAEEEAAGQNL
jgi:hypothetical protein